MDQGQTVGQQTSEPVVKETVSQPVETAPVQAQPTEDWKSKYEEVNNRAQNVEGNVIGFFRQYPEAEKAFSDWANGKPGKLQDYLQKLDEVPEKKVKSENFDPSRVEEMVSKLVEERLDPVYNQLASSQTERLKSSLQTENPWLTDELYNEFRNRFNKECGSRAQTYVSQGMNPGGAQKQAIMDFKGFEPQDLILKFMRKEWTENVSSGKKTVPLPHGMVSPAGTKAGQVPGLFEQAKKAYKEASKNRTDEATIANMVGEYAEQMGMKATELYKKIQED